MDLASPLLLANAASGMPIRGATLVARKAGGDQQEFLKVELKDILVTSVQSGGSSGGDPTEQFTLSFGSMQMRYQAQDPKGGPGETVTTNFKGGC